MNEWLERNQGHVIVLLLSIVVNGALVFLLIRPAPASLHIVPPTPPPAPQGVRVSVVGAVAAPDVYTLTLGSLVKDAVQAAGGPNADADLARINLAREVQDQEQILVPAASDPVATAPALRSATADLLDLNAASAAELEGLPGIGPELARRIVEYRTLHGPFRSIDDLFEVSGIGPTVFDRIQDSVTVN